MSGTGTRTAALLLALAATGARPPAARADEPEAPPAAPARPTFDPDAPLLVTQRGDPIFVFEGALTAGFRLVGGDDDGRYEQDVNLDSGFRLFDLRVDGRPLVDDTSIDTFSLHGSGYGDPDSRTRLRIGRDDAWDLRLSHERHDYVHRATFDPHPFDTRRERYAGDLRLQLSDTFAVTFGADTADRDGSARLDTKFRKDQSFAVKAPIEARRDGYHFGIDGRSGKVRFAVRHAWSDLDDDAYRTLVDPGTVAGETSAYRTTSDVDTALTTARIGTSLFDDRLDVQVSGGWDTARTDSLVRGDDVILDPGGDGDRGTPDDLLYSTETRGRTKARLRELFGRLDIALEPHVDWEVLLRVEQRRADERGRADVRLRNQTPPYSDPVGPWGLLSQSNRVTADLDREAVDGIWRPNDAWRLRVGVEHVSEEVEVDSDRMPVSSPSFLAWTGGVDWKPNRTFDGSLLVRRVKGAGESTELSPDTGESASLRFRYRPHGGWHATSYARIRQRREDDSRSRVRSNAWGAAAGWSGDGGFVEASWTHHVFVVATDTRFVTNLLLDPTPRKHRVSYGERVDTFTLDASRNLAPDWRIFASGSWTGADGDLPSIHRDIGGGIGWRARKNLEFRAEVRGIAWDEQDRNVDDYGATLVTLSLTLEF